MIDAHPTFGVLGDREIRVAVFTPGGAEPPSPLPVIVDPYGGPHFAKVLNAYRRCSSPSGSRIEGFAVLVADGRGTPGRGVAWEHAVYRDFAGPVLDDQVDALQAAAERFGFPSRPRGDPRPVVRRLPRGDGSAPSPRRVPRRRRRGPGHGPDLYDTAYTERYLGHPQEEPDTYRRNSLIEDAPNLSRPLLLIHGLADDNVFVANTLRMSRALTEAGRPHSVVPLSGITHMTTEESVAENLLLLQVRFLREALGLVDEVDAVHPA